MKKITSLPFYYSTQYPPYVALGAEEIALRDQLNNMTDRGEIEYEDLPCLCGARLFALIGTYDRYRIKQQTVICKACGLIQSMPRMTQKAYSWFYSSDFYRKLYDHNTPLRTEDITGYYQERYSKKRYEYITSHIHTPITSVLEIGCAGGWNLYPFFSKGARVVGYDLGPDLVAKGRSLGMNLNVGTIDDVPQQEKFDVIILAHVLEHLANPREILQKLASHLKPQGAVYIEIPNIERYKKFLGDVQLQNAHLYYYSPNTLLPYAKEAGLEPRPFTVDILGPNMGGLFYATKPIPAHMTDMSGEYARMVRMIRKNELKYRLKHIAAQLHLLKIIASIRNTIRKIMHRA
jgi:2-polyprenyl-3-methyl-5-hydroxy-6-metoxy-1,4-benzoquinol methylase